MNGVCCLEIFNTASLSNSILVEEPFYSVLRAVIFGVIALFGYYFNAYLKNRNNKRGNAVILLDELKRISDVEDLDDKTSIDRIPAKMPGNEIYLGLLSTGNVKYFHPELRKNLAHFYAHFKINKLNPDQNLCIGIMKDLEKIKNNRRLPDRVFDKLTYGHYK